MLTTEKQVEVDILVFGMEICTKQIPAIILKSLSLNIFIYKITHSWKSGIFSYQFQQIKKKHLMGFLINGKELFLSMWEENISPG